jgi:C-terminal processing protease CtpA/Prc
VRTPEGELREIEVTRDAMSGTPPFMTRQLENAFAGPTIRTRSLPGGIRYVEIPNFDHEQALADFETMIDAIEPGQVEGMIIDLRYNMGGSSSIADPMVACLIEAPVRTPTMRYRSYAGAREAWGQGAQWHEIEREIQPRDGARYAGTVIVLVGHLTHSSAEDFALELRAAGRARLVGQRTAGGAGNALTRSLPGGGTLRVATFTALTQQGEEYVGRGVEPDVRVEITPDDLVAQRDPALERAIALLSGR